MASVDSGVETENDSNDSSSTPENRRSVEQSVASNSSLRDSRSASENSFFSGRDPMPSTSQGGASNHLSPEKSCNENVLNLTQEQASAFNARFVMSHFDFKKKCLSLFVNRTVWLMKFPTSVNSHNLDFMFLASVITTHQNP
jgi:hypothetical protein